MERIEEFQGKNRFLSNFYPARVEFGGVVYPTVEHAYQAAKTLDPELRKKVRAAAKPGLAKRLGRGVALRPNWETVKCRVMFLLLRWKFHLQPLRGQLLATGAAELVEGNRWGDTYWGVCRGEGENRLGKLLMQVRKELQKRPEAEPKCR
jgi:ribA/ribD-fused uncharacterized protein